MAQMKQNRRVVYELSDKCALTLFLAVIYFDRARLSYVCLRAGSSGSDDTFASIDLSLCIYGTVLLVIRPKTGPGKLLNFFFCFGLFLE